ncbi:store-operated calcium entry-associated regulatory factor isoform X1 [Carcharodon carcharias]|uniref:store-operated calcium entry-associated regulatory factor isoform X1 n=1 Tax=Carcharodon carcharias TaxID=13397 RepID=UPI001B7DCF10|nr:store-operated calcium entry-associated regulatory factor isoform X1 [Carcharodon carcharias]
MLRLTLCYCLWLLQLLLQVKGAHDSERVLLREIQALTLHSGRYTTGRRTSPVRQLQCVGGTAGCNAFLPKVVQCYNKGWDGYDVQWECKTDMDKAYRFGAITVSCEGYNYPEDPYILRGSCGLEYVIELTEEGLRRKKPNSGFAHVSDENSTFSHDSFSFMMILVLFALAYLVYMVCLRSQHNRNEFPQDNGQNPGDYCNGAGPSAQPPPPGFKPAYRGCTTDETFCGEAHPRSTGSGPGFWTGMGAGGLLGYLLGSRRSRPNTSSYPYYPDYSSYQPQEKQEPNWNTESPGTRSTSGFGGTKRR